MMVPRSFLYSRNQSQPTSNSAPETKPLSTSQIPITNTTTSIFSLSSYESSISTWTMAKTPVVSSAPVVIPVRHKDAKSPRNNGRDASIHISLRPRNRNNIKPAVAALLASTAIPRPKAVRRRDAGQPLTVAAVFNHNMGKEYNSAVAMSPMAVLLSPPEECLDPLDSDTGSPSYVSRLTLSSDDSTPPSLTSSRGGSPYSSPESPITPKSSLPPLRLCCEACDEHPLLDHVIEGEDLELSAEGTLESPLRKTSPSRQRSAISNLTALLGAAARSAAESIKKIKPPMVPAENLLIRGIISKDDTVLFPDVRMPTKITGQSSTTIAPLQTHLASSLASTGTGVVTASIEMRTYKKPQPDPVHSATKQRDFRENSDFLRVHTMEMLMRHNGKLAENMRGRAVGALPPRQLSTRPYAIGAGGVPVRWIALNAV